MADDPVNPDKPERSRKRENEYEARRVKRIQVKIAKEVIGPNGPSAAKLDQWNKQLRVLEEKTRGNPTDADGDIDFAYRNMALPSLSPSAAPSMSGWSWYLYSRTEPIKFLEICAKREDAKSKMAGTITNQRMEDDKRNQFAVIDRLEKALTLDVAAIVKELMEKFPEDVLRAVRKFDVAT